MNVDDIIQSVYDKKTGFYVDCGANNGIVLSKTNHLEQKGWDGICIEALPENYDKLQSNRKAKCIQAVLSDKENEQVTFFVPVRKNAFKTGGTLSSTLSSRGNKKEYHTFTTTTLNRVLEENNVKRIDYLKTDLEGMDAKVLLGLDFKKYSIDLLIYEQLPSLRKQPAEAKVYDQLATKLKENGYKLIKDVTGRGTGTKFTDPIDIVWCNEKYLNSIE